MNTYFYSSLNGVAVKLEHWLNLNRLGYKNFLHGFTM